MTCNSKPATRRTLILGAAALPGAAGLALLSQPRQAEAAGVTPKANVKYQTQPHGAQQCGKCNYFVAGPNATAPGTCKVVAGPILPNGWCILFAAKAH